MQTHILHTMIGVKVSSLTQSNLAHSRAPISLVTRGSKCNSLALTLQVVTAGST